MKRKLSSRIRDQIASRGFRVLCVALAGLLALGQMLAQEAPTAPSATPNAVARAPWDLSLTVDVYLLVDEGSYATPIVTADRGWLHLEARYNYENLRTASLWAGYNFGVGKKVVLSFTPMIGGIFGRTTGIAPGCDASLTYKRVELSISNEYVFDTSDKRQNFYYSWPQLTYSPADWLSVGLAAQQTKAQAERDLQGGFLLGFSHKHAAFTVYTFNPGKTDISVVLEAGWSF